MNISTATTRSYYLLTKPGIIVGNAITTIAGFLLASKGFINYSLFLATFLGLGLIIASACVLNNCIDREADQKMARTKNRPLAKGTISVRNASIFATLLGILGTVILAIYTNPLALSIALFGFFIYVVVYSYAKYYTTHATLIGSIAGAVPPVVGYCAAYPHLDLPAFLFFSILVLWQMPHFYAIAIYRSDDYSAASVPTLPLKKGLLTTKIHMVLYTAAFLIVALLLPAGPLYFYTTAFFGSLWFLLCVQGFWAKNDRLWARNVFRFSLLVILAISISISLTK